MINKIYIPLTALLIAGAPVHAGDDQGRIKSLMHTFLMEIYRLQPYMNSEQDFASPKGKEVVGESLMLLDKKVQNPPPELKSHTGFRITFSLLADHIARTKQLFEKGELEYARIRLNSTTNMCASCHMQAPKISSQSPFAVFNDLSEQANYTNATFLFTIRRYDEALAQLDQLARRFPKSAVTSDQLNDVYRRKLAIFARIKRNPTLGISNLREDLKNKDIPMDIQRNIQAWIEAFQKWQAESENPEKLKTEQLVSFVAKDIPPLLNRRIAPADPDLLKLLRLSGLLYERLYNSADAKTTQQLLYYLAMCERSLAPLNWYSLNEIYLKECVVRYPHQAFSKKCFDAYREGMQERFANRPMPEGVRKSIDALEDYL